MSFLLDSWNDIRNIEEQAKKSVKKLSLDPNGFIISVEFYDYKDVMSLAPTSKEQEG